MGACGKFARAGSDGLAVYCSVVVGCQSVVVTALRGFAVPRHGHEPQGESAPNRRGKKEKTTVECLLATSSFPFDGPPTRGGLRVGLHGVPLGCERIHAAVTRCGGAAKGHRQL